jgi:hypothetical protein
MIVLAAATPGQTQRFEQWYDERHMSDMLKVPGIVSARRYAVAPMKLPEGVAGFDSLCIYEIEADDVTKVLEECGQRMGGPKMPTDPALASARTLALLALPKHALETK